MVDTSNADYVNLKLRSARIISSESLIAEIPDGSIVETTGKDEIVENGLKWIEVKYKDQNGKEYVGWVASGYLKESDLVEYVVNIDGNKNSKLNVRDEPGTESEIVANIENGTHIKLQQASIDARREKDGYEWVKVHLNDDTYGYVAFDYLKEPKEKEEKSANKAKDLISKEELNRILKRTRVNEDGKVVGIDFSDCVDPSELERLLTDDNAIPSEGIHRGSKARYYFDDLSGKIDFAIIKIGARGWGKEGKFAEYNNYIEQAKICEKLGIPYGFYFYSTALTTEEADEEISYVERALNTLENRKYNILPLALNVEVEGEVSRLIGHDVTDVMAYWANQAEPKFGKVMLYTEAVQLTGGNTGIMDIKRLNELILSGPPKVWIVGMRGNNSKAIGSYRQNYINRIADDTDICMVQYLLDISNEEEGMPNLDIDIIDADVYKEMLRSRVKEIGENEPVRE